MLLEQKEVKEIVASLELLSSVDRIGTTKDGAHMELLVTTFKPSRV